MSDLSRHDGEEWLIGLFLNVASDELASLFVEQQIGIHELVVRCEPTFIIIPTPFAARVWQVGTFVSMVGRLWDHAVFDVDIKRIGGRTIRRHKRLVEPTRIRPINQRSAFLVVDFQRVVEATTQSFAFAIEPAKPDMPLSKDTGSVAFLLQHLCDRQSVWL